MGTPRYQPITPTVVDHEQRVVVDFQLLELLAKFVDTVVKPGFHGKALMLLFTEGFFIAFIDAAR